MSKKLEEKVVAAVFGPGDPIARLQRVTEILSEFGLRPTVAEEQAPLVGEAREKRREAQKAIEVAEAVAEETGVFPVQGGFIEEEAE